MIGQVAKLFLEINGGLSTKYFIRVAIQHFFSLGNTRPEVFAGVPMLLFLQRQKRPSSKLGLTLTNISFDESKTTLIDIKTL